MKLELRSDGFEQIEASIQEIENLAWEGYENLQSQSKAAVKLRQIAANARELREALKEVVIIDPNAEAEEPPKAAA